MMLTLFTLFTLFILFTIQTTLHHLKSVMNLFLRISMAYIVISSREVAKNTNKFKFAGVLITIIVIIISTLIFITIIGCTSPPTPPWLDRSNHFCSAPLRHHNHHHHHHHHHHHGHRVHKSTHTPMVGWIWSLLLSTTSSLKPTIEMMKKVYHHFFTLFYYHHNFHHHHSRLSNQINLT